MRPRARVIPRWARGSIPALIALVGIAMAASGAQPAAPPHAVEIARKQPAQPNPAAPKQPAPAPGDAARKVPPAVPGPPAASPSPQTPAPDPAGPAEIIEADVSTHTVAVTSAFAGTEIVVFGSVVRSRQESAQSGYYDVVVVAEGRGAPAVVRSKDRVGGLWINTASVRFEGLPLYSATASTRPVEEIAEPAALVANGIGFPRARMIPGRGSGAMTPAEIDDYKTAFLRLKQKDGLYVRSDFGVIFIGRSLFRASLKLPANIPLGALSARVFLFHEGQLLSIHTASVVLRRTGLERLIYDFAFDHPISYGILSVILAVIAGLAASIVFRRPMS